MINIWIILLVSPSANHAQMNYEQKYIQLEPNYTYNKLLEVHWSIWQTSNKYNLVRWYRLHHRQSLLYISFSIGNPLFKCSNIRVLFLLRYLRWFCWRKAIWQGRLATRFAARFTVIEAELSHRIVCIKIFLQLFLFMTNNSDDISKCL